MPIFNNDALIDRLSDDVRAAVATAEALRDQDVATLRKPGPDGSWSPLQHFHHLNFYAEFYADSIEKTLSRARPRGGDTYRAGWLGDYFTRIIGPAETRQPLKMKMKTPSNARPPVSEELEPVAILEEFISLQKRLLYLLQRARSVDLGRNRVTTALGWWLRLKLGDTFRFVVAHQQRHFQHIHRAQGVPGRTSLLRGSNHLFGGMPIFAAKSKQ